MSIGRGTRSLALLEEYQVNRLLLDLQEQEELALVLEDGPGWIKEYEDEYSQIWSRLAP